MKEWRSGQMSITTLDMADLMSENHLLKNSKQIISFRFIYDLRHIPL